MYLALPAFNLRISNDRGGLINFVRVAERHQNHVAPKKMRA